MVPDKSIAIPRRLVSNEYKKQTTNRARMPPRAKNTVSEYSCPAKIRYSF